MAEHPCPGCLERDKAIDELTRQLAELRQQVRDLQARLGINASNSSLPPSQNPPQAPPPVTKKKTGKKPGGQPGHPPRLKQLLPPERLTRTRAFVPAHCERCATPLPTQPGAADPPPLRHQVAELPAVRAEVVEYQGHARTCPCCGHLTRAVLPHDIRARSIGPSLTAVMSYLSGCHQVSKRGVEEIVATVFEVPVSLGTVKNLESEVSEALAPAHAEALEAVRGAGIKSVDETGWKERGQRCWLWLAATATVAAFIVHPRRNLAALYALLGETIWGIIGSDRWPVYDEIRVVRRQVCWAHLKRDFQKCVDYGGPAAEVGRAGLSAAEELFDAWHLFRGGGIGRSELSYRLDPVARRLKRVLGRGQRCAHRKTATFCRNLLVLEAALWRFVVTEGVEPTNNHAERVLRRGVLWRKKSFGTQSEGGSRFVERMLTVVQTLRLQKRSVVAYLKEAVIAHRQALPAPKLLPTG
jgi:transposase